MIEFTFQDGGTAEWFVKNGYVPVSDYDVVKVYASAEELLYIKERFEGSLPWVMEVHKETKIKNVSYWI